MKRPAERRLRRAAPRALATACLLLAAAAALVSAALPRAGAAGPTPELVSVRLTNSFTGDAASHTPSLSADGRYVAFMSEASDLAPGDANASADVFWSDLQTGEVRLVSVNSAGTGSSNGYSTSPVISGDGQFVAFLSTGTNIVANDTNANQDVYRRNVNAGTTQLVSVNSIGTSGGNGSSYFPSISSDGRYIAFASEASNLLSIDPNTRRDIYRRDMTGGITQLVSVNSAGTSVGSGESDTPVMSADGLFVAFVSSATNLGSFDTNSQPDVFRRNMAASSTQLVSINSAGNTTGNGASQTPSISADGRYVAFQSGASNLVSGVTDNNFTSDVFRRDLTTGTTQLASVNTAGTATGNNFSENPVISADGLFVAFQSYASDLAPNDTGNSGDVYRRNVNAGTTQLVSVNSSGAQAGNNYSYQPAISADGRYVFFVSYASDLVADDNNSRYDIFRRDLTAGTTQLASANADGAGGGNADSYFPAVSADGRYVAFQSLAGDLVASDHNGVSDVFRRDLTAGATAAASKRNPAAGSTSLSGNQGSDSPVVSSDGRYIVFVSNASNLVAGDTNSTQDVFRRDMLTGTTQLVSVNAAGTGGGSSSSYGPVISPDGRYVAFLSHAGNLGPNDTNNKQDVYVRDMQAGVTRLASVNAAGTDGGSENSYGPSLTPDGRYVVFYGHSNNLVSGDTNSTFDIFRRDLTTGTTQLVSVNSAGTNGGAGASYIPLISADGRYVVFYSAAGDLVAGDTNGSVNDVFRRDLTAGTTQLVSVNSSGAGSGDNSSEYPSISADGRYVAFHSAAGNLVAGDTNGTIQDIFRRDMTTGTTQLVSVNSAGTGSGNSGSYNPSISSDGRHVAFISYSTNLAAGDTNANGDIFRRDMTAATTQLVSVNSAGTNGGNAGSYGHVLSADGRFIAYASEASDLVPGDANGTQDVFLRDVTAGTTQLASVSLGGTASGNNAAYNPSISANGRSVAFMSMAGNLVAGDSNGAPDVFRFGATPANSVPVASASPSPFVTNEDSSVQITLTGTDADDNDLTFAVTDAPDNGTLSNISSPDCTAAGVCTAAVTYTPAANYNGADSFKFKVNDGAADSADATVSVNVNAVPDLSVADVSLLEGNAGTTTFAFNVTLDSPAGAGGVSFNASTADGAADPANAGSDYAALNGLSGSVAAGQTGTTVNVTVNGDAVQEEDETFTLTLANVSGAAVADAAALGTIVNDDGAPAAGQVIISEFRLRGPGAAGGDPLRDEYVELYNNTDSAVTVANADGSAGWAVVSGHHPGAPVFVVPKGTVIPARGHYLAINSAGYSLTSYAAGDANWDASYAGGDIPDSAGLALFRTANPASFNAANRLDAVGPTSVPNALYREGAGYAPFNAAGAEHALVRSVVGGRPQDSGDNAADFLLVAVNPAGVAGARRGSPGPQNAGSPLPLGGLVSPSPFAPCLATSVPPNRVRDETADPANNSSAGTLEIRRRFTNNTGADITRLRFRIVDLTTYPEGGGAAELRARSSANLLLANPCTGENRTVRGVTVEQPPTQPQGGGFNSSLLVEGVTAATPLAAGQSVEVRFLFGVEQAGDYRFRVVAEGVKADPSAAPVVDGMTLSDDSKTSAPPAFSAAASSGLGGSASWGVEGDTQDPSADRDVYTLGMGADAYVKGATPTSNFGALSEMQVKRTYNPGAGKGRQAYLRFDTTPVQGQVQKATLRVYARLSAVTQANANIPLAVFPVSAVWGELTLNWNNKPLPNVPFELARVTVTDDVWRWYEFDVTTFVNQERAAGRAVTGVLLRNMLRGDIGDYYTAVNSREAAANQPQLVIEQ